MAENKKINWTLLEEKVLQQNESLFLSKRETLMAAGGGYYVTVIIRPVKAKEAFPLRSQRYQENDVVLGISVYESNPWGDPIPAEEEHFEFSFKRFSFTREMGLKDYESALKLTKERLGLL